MRKATIERNTLETRINLEMATSEFGRGVYEGSCGIPFFDHMLNAFSLHGGLNMRLSMSGDLDVDSHHSIEDLGIVIGKALLEIIGDKNGINRFGSACIPMDEALSRCVLDFSGRPFFVFDCQFTNTVSTKFDFCMVKEFFRAVSVNACLTLHLTNLYGENDHHKAESLFKAFARAVKEAISVSGGGIMSTKGSL